MENPGKVKVYFDKAIQAQKYSKDLVDYISELRTKIMAYTEFGIMNKADDPKQWAIADTIPLSEVSTKDNYDKPMQILMAILKTDIMPKVWF